MERKKLTAITAEIFRFNPEVDAKPRYETIRVPYLWEKMTALDILEYANQKLGMDIGFRSYCGVRKCGTCGVSIDGKPSLSCMTVVNKNRIRIEPLPNFGLVRDLVIDRSDYDKRIAEADPYLLREKLYEHFPEKVDNASIQDSVLLRRCIGCLLCTSVCPAFKANPRFAGPAVFVQMGKYNLDPRDGGFEHRAELASANAVHNCVRCYACVRTCPTDARFKIIKVIENLQREAAEKGCGDERGVASPDMREMLFGFGSFRKKD